MDQTDEQLLEGIRRVLTYLPSFEEPGFEFGTWRSQNPPPGVVSPDWFDLSEMATGWFHAIHESGLMPKGFDWVKWRYKAQNYVDQPERLESADLDTLGNLLETHLRLERFCEGHLENMYKCGHLIAIMRRLKQIADQMEE